LSFNKLRFGTAGIPTCSKGKGPGVLDGLRTVRELGLEAMELEFVRGVWMSEALADLTRQAAETYDVQLTVHAPFYINLNGETAVKKASQGRILDSARLGARAGAWSVTFHSAYYMKAPSDQVYAVVKPQLHEMAQSLKKIKAEIRISPELTGKETQFGNLDELTRLASEVEGVGYCVDFAHLYARTVGRENSYKEFCATFDTIKKAGGARALKAMHIHVTGIVSGPKGEKHHVNLKDCEFRYRDLLKAFKDYAVAGTVICESPDIEGDALLLQKTYKDL